MVEDQVLNDLAEYGADLETGAIQLDHHDGRTRKDPVPTIVKVNRRCLVQTVDFIHGGTQESLLGGFKHLEIAKVACTNVGFWPTSVFTGPATWANVQKNVQKTRIRINLHFNVRSLTGRSRHDQRQRLKTTTTGAVGTLMEGRKETTFEITSLAS